MEALLNIGKAFQKIDIESIILETLKEFEPRMIDLNQSQLQEGRTSEGKKMPRYNAGYYKRVIKGDKKNWDLNLTGGLYSKMFAAPDGIYVNFGSKDDVAQYIDEHPDSDNFYGLDKESIKVLRGEIWPVIIKKINNAIRLN